MDIQGDKISDVVDGHTEITEITERFAYGEFWF
jgi:hypothetical protein